MSTPIIEGRKQPGWCGPASIVWAARNLGIEVTQEYMAQVMGTTYEHGTDWTNMVAGAEAIGLIGFWVIGMELAELEDMRQRGCQIILNWMDCDQCRDSDEREDGHYSVLRRHVDGVVELDDPSLEGRITTMRVSDLIRERWFDLDGDDEKKYRMGAMVVAKSKGVE